jgi:hypothetical protein
MQRTSAVKKLLTFGADKFSLAEVNKNDQSVSLWIRSFLGQNSVRAARAASAPFEFINRRDVNTSLQKSNRRQTGCYEFGPYPYFPLLSSTIKTKGGTQMAKVKKSGNKFGVLRATLVFLLLIMMVSFTASTVAAADSKPVEL